MARMNAPNTDTTVQQVAVDVDDTKRSGKQCRSQHLLDFAVDLVSICMYSPRPLPTTGRAIDMFCSLCDEFDGVTVVASDPLRSRKSNTLRGAASV